jgi:apolipoprotein N-acyltransferase
MTDFIRGTQQPEPMQWKGHRLSVNICYEDLFGEELAKRFVQGADKMPEVLVNISNIGWFGDNYVVDQHLNIARMRSMEFNRPTVRATNSGGTAIINAQGEIQDALKPYTRGVLTGSVSTDSAAGITPYAYWAGHWGLKPMWIWCLTIWALAYMQYKRASAREKSTYAH